MDHGFRQKSGGERRETSTACDFSCVSRGVAYCTVDFSVSVRSLTWRTRPLQPGLAPVNMVKILSMSKCRHRPHGEYGEYRDS